MWGKPISRVKGTVEIFVGIREIFQGKVIRNPPWGGGGEDALLGEDLALDFWAVPKIGGNKK